MVVVMERASPKKLGKLFVVVEAVVKRSRLSSSNSCREGCRECSGQTETRVEAWLAGCFGLFVLACRRMQVYGSMWTWNLGDAPRVFGCCNNTARGSRRPRVVGTAAKCTFRLGERRRLVLGDGS